MSCGVWQWYIQEKLMGPKSPPTPLEIGLNGGDFAAVTYPPRGKMESNVAKLCEKKTDNQYSIHACPIRGILFPHIAVSSSQILS